ncbi:MAG: MlaD family protein [Deltaproteobacteria bacterium]|nr:MlaD family protein [Deltaproteobacteria bacterium]
MENKTARKTSKFMIGLFVTLGSLIGVVLVIWLGAAKYFEKGLIYATYFDESVQGLQMDSSVKYRGVDVGRVLKIGVAPDNKLVEVVMKVDFSGGAETDLVAKLKSAGITGIVFIELDRWEGEEPVPAHEMTFKSEYPVIPSRPSEIRQIMTGLAEIYGKIHKIDFEGISMELRNTAKSVNTFFNNARLNNTMKHIESTTMSLDSTTRKIDKMVAEGRVDKVLVETHKTLIETRQLMTEVRNEIGAMKMADTAVNANRFLDHLDGRTRKISADMEDTLQDIKSNSENLNRLIERIQSNPSELIFGNPGTSDRMREEK